MKRILYLTDPEVSSKPQLEDLGKFLANASREATLDLIVVGGDYINMHDLTDHHRFNELKEQLGEEQAKAQLKSENESMDVHAMRPTIDVPEPWYELEQIAEVYSDLVRTIQSNTSAEVVLCAGNQDRLVLRDAIKSESKGRIHNPEFNVATISDLYVATIPGSGEGVGNGDYEQTYCWTCDINPFLYSLMRRIGKDHVDVLVTHPAPRTKQEEHVLGLGVDQIGNWKRVQKTKTVDETGDNVGYEIMRNVGRVIQPSLWLVGHFHEARYKSKGKIYPGAVDRQGSSYVVNPGSFFWNPFTHVSAALIEYQDRKVHSISLMNEQGHVELRSR